MDVVSVLIQGPTMLIRATCPPLNHYFLMFIWNVYRRVFGEIIIRVFNIFSIYYDVNVYIKKLFKIYNFQFFSSVLESPLSIKNIGYNYLNFFWEYFLVARLI